MTMSKMEINNVMITKMTWPMTTAAERSLRYVGKEEPEHDELVMEECDALESENHIVSLGNGKSSWLAGRYEH